MLIRFEAMLVHRRRIRLVRSACIGPQCGTTPAHSASENYTNFCRLRYRYVLNSGMPRNSTLRFLSVMNPATQAAGGITAITTDNVDTINLGSNVRPSSSVYLKKGNCLIAVPSQIFLAGLILQLVSFVFFLVIYLRLLFLVHQRNPYIWTRDACKPWFSDWRTLACAFVVSCIGILVRSVFRTVELAEGFKSNLATSEPLFYGLDTLPLFITVSVYVPFWPGRFIGREETGSMHIMMDNRGGDSTKGPESGSLLGQ